VGEIQEFVTGARPVTEPDRVLATILFTDIVGSTRLAADHGDLAWRDLLERHHALVRSELARFRGREVDTAGDGFLAVFDGPGARVSALAGASEVLVSSTVRDLVAGVRSPIRGPWFPRAQGRTRPMADSRGHRRLTEPGTSPSGQGSEPLR
jgi:class 3 adenylate cyclase